MFCIGSSVPSNILFVCFLSKHLFISQLVMVYLYLSAAIAATKNQVEKVLQITYSVWNSIVLDTSSGCEKNISTLRETAKGDQMASAMIEQLISRKMELYADDLRLIGEFSITQKMGRGVFAPMHEIRQRFGEIKCGYAEPIS